MNTTIDKLRILTSQEFRRGTPLISFFVPLKGAYLPPTKMLAGLIQTANSILEREGHPRIKITTPDWQRWEKEGARSLAVYHAEGLTTLLPMHVPIEPRVVVANSFHVKPLIASHGSAGEALLMTFHKRGCSLTRVTASESMVHETYIPEGYDLNDRWLEQLSRENLREFLDYMKAEVSEHRSRNTRFLVIDGASEPMIRNEDFWLKLRLPVRILDRTVLAESAVRAVHEVQRMVDEEARNRIRKTVNETLKLSPLSQQNTRSIEQIAKLILGRKIKKLFVSLDDLHFGTLDPKTGETKLHKGQLNASDDDVLDDLVELALKNGVEVQVVSRDLMPSNRPFLVA